MSQESKPHHPFDSLWAFGLVWSLIALALGFLNYFDWLTVKRDDRSLWFADFFRNGLSSSDDKSLWPTYPMWGYGGILAITTNRTALLVIQASLALTSILLLVHYLQSRSILNTRGVRVLKILILLSVPLYAVHLVLWPNSYAISLGLISLVLLATALDQCNVGQGCLDSNAPRKSWRIVLVSALCFGLALNFRSDYWLFPMGAAPVLLLLAVLRRRAIAILGLWLFVIATCLIPWMVYTYQACGHAVITSTNAGHVAFLGLGSAPDNKWGITCEDNDPAMHQAVFRHYGKVRSTFDHDVDQFLKSEFVRLVAADPMEYVRKCAFSLRSAIFSGSYVAKFYRQSDNDPVTIEDLPGYQQEFLRDPARFIQARGIVLLLRLGATVANDKIARVIVPIGYVGVVFGFVRALRQRENIAMLGVLAVGYQTTLMTVLPTIPMYMANVYLWHLVLIAYAVGGRVRVVLSQYSLDANRTF